MNLAEVCRLCLVKSMKTSEELFFPIDEVFEKKFLEITNLTLDTSEGFPSTICISCVTEFEDFYNYRSGLMQKQRRLNLLLGLKNDKPQAVFIKTEAKVSKTVISEMLASDEDNQVESQENENVENLEVSEEDGTAENEEFDSPETEYDNNQEILYETQDSEQESTRMIFEEVLESENDDTETYQLDLIEDNNDTYVRESKTAKINEEYLQNEVQDYAESDIEDMEQVEDEEIFFAINDDELNENCIIVGSEDGENSSNKRQKRKYVKQGKGKEKLFKCWMDDCCASFSFRSTMKKHMLQQHDMVCDKKTCLMCGRQFEEYSDFLNHVKKHTRKSECDICKLTFVSEEKMQAHRNRVHKNDEHERCFQCHLCDASFKRKEHVNSHIIYRHTEDRQFSCKDCSSTFLTRQDLKNHEKSHQQLKKNCPYCSYECRDLKTIKLHCLKLHNTSKIYKCAFCEEAYEMYKDYQSHKKNCYSIVDSTTTE